MPTAKRNKKPNAPRLLEFLKRNTIESAPMLPLVHTTRALHIRSIIDNNRISANPCDVFRGEKLNYFFVGRPSYKYALAADDEFWQLPVCFILDFETRLNAKRVFPFDSGGFVKKQIPSMMAGMSLANFDVSSDKQAPEKLIGTFFGTSKAYFRLKGRKTSEFISRHDLSPLDAEIHALHKLSIPKKSHTFDDRQFSIEIQTENDLPLTARSVLAVVAPITYFDDGIFLRHVENNWKAAPLSYDLYPVNPEYYYLSIYEKVAGFLDSKGYL